jgi:hypothetical protein
MIEHITGLIVLMTLVAACAVSAPLPADNFCISAPRDGINDYLAENADALAEQIVANNLVVLREPSAGERYRVATRSAGPCGDGEESATTVELQAVLTEIGNSAPVTTHDECTVEMPFRSEQESRMMLPYIFLSGLRYPGVGTSGPGWEVQSDGSTRTWPLTGHLHAKDSCAAVNAVAAALLRHRDSMER